MKFNCFILLPIINYINGIKTSKDASFEKIVNEPLNIVLNLNSGTRSHIKYLLEIARPLKEQGHNIVFASPTDFLHFGDEYNYTQFDLGYSDNGNYRIKSDKPVPRIASPVIHSYDSIMPYYPKLDEEIKPDLMICDYMARACIDYSISHKLPLIIGFQFLNRYSSTAPYLNSDIIEVDLPLTKESMTFTDRYYEIFIHKRPIDEAIQTIESNMKELRKQYGIDPNIREFDNYDNYMKIANNFIGWDISRPVHPTLKLVGPIKSSSITPLENLEPFLDQRNKVVYIAFGSKQILGSDELKLVISSAHLAFKQGIVDGVILATKTNFDPSSYIDFNSLQNNDIEGFLFMDHAPQVAILKHKAVKLFVTHGGLESCFEGVSSLTPLLAMPFKSDQPHHAKLITHHGIGYEVNKDSETVQDFVSKMKKLIEDEDGNVKKNLLKLSTISHYNSLGLEDAAKFIHSFAQYARICRKTQSNDATIPCEMQPYITADQLIPKYRSYNYDIYIVHYTIILCIFGFVVHLIRKYLFKKKDDNDELFKEL